MSGIKTHERRTGITDRRQAYHVVHQEVHASPRSVPRAIQTTARHSRTQHSTAQHSTARQGKGCSNENGQGAQQHSRERERISACCDCFNCTSCAMRLGPLTPSELSQSTMHPYLNPSVTAYIARNRSLLNPNLHSMTQQHSTHSTAHHSTAQHKTARQRAVQHVTAQHNISGTPLLLPHACT